MFGVIDPAAIILLALVIALVAAGVWWLIRRCPPRKRTPTP